MTNILTKQELEKKISGLTFYHQYGQLIEELIKDVKDEDKKAVESYYRQVAENYINKIFNEKEEKDLADTFETFAY